MRQTHLFAALAGMLAVASPAFAQEAVILLPEVEVRSGPSKNFFATSKLKQGDRVTVLRESKEQPGWYEIKPPVQSFSWINAKDVKQNDATHATVECDPARPAPIRPGSRLVNIEPNRISMNLTNGTIVVIVDRPLTVPSGTWLPILPHPNEVRYIPAESVQQAKVVAATQNSPTNWTLTPQGYTMNNVFAEAEKAAAAGDIAGARRLYQQVANTSPDASLKQLATNKLYSLPPTNPVQGQTTSNVRPDETRTAFSPGVPPTNLIKVKDAIWSSYGRLYETKLAGENGQPLYALDTGSGQTTYVSTSPGKSLQSYIGRTVSVYGPTMYRAESAARLPFVVATHVAVP